MGDTRCGRCRRCRLVYIVRCHRHRDQHEHRNMMSLLSNFDDDLHCVQQQQQNKHTKINKIHWFLDLYEYVACTAHRTHILLLYLFFFYFVFCLFYVPHLYYYSLNFNANNKYALFYFLIGYFTLLARLTAQVKQNGKIKKIKKAKETKDKYRRFSLNTQRTLFDSNEIII